MVEARYIMNKLRRLAINRSTMTILQKMANFRERKYSILYDAPIYKKVSGSTDL